MTELIEINKYPVKDVLSLLLTDKTTGKNIVFATDTYQSYGFRENSLMTEAAILGFDSCDIQPRIFKAQAEQNERTRKKAEVFTPTWICNQMNNHIDSEWFGRENVFNTADGQSWKVSRKKISFPKDKSWITYIDSRRLEITCGEAPYIVSRYDATTGEIIPIERRIGLLDRKLRVVNENAATEDEWLEWAARAFQSIYGYEFQGDNLLIARINLLVTFCDYLEAKWKRTATKTELKKIANIIAWNIWQMNGLTDTIPVIAASDEPVQLSLFSLEAADEQEHYDYCKIQDWRKKSPLRFKNIKDGKKGKCMKFDYVIGNPPYQEDSQGKSNTATPIYNYFMDAAYQVSDVVELISPARFLFNAGYTPKPWNEKMLSDAHLKVLFYEQDSEKVFSGTDIKGGIAITLHDKTREFDAIETFTIYPTLNIILTKIKKRNDFNSLSDIIVTSFAYHFTPLMHNENPSAKDRLSKGHQNDLLSNVFETLPEIFTDEKPNDNNEYIQIFGLDKRQRAYKYIKRDYINNVVNTNYYKVFLPKAMGEGKLGETLSNPLIGEPNVGYTSTFISIGKFETISEAETCLKYLKTKFARTLLGVLKITQDNTPSKWRFVPLQDFTSASDIDWSKSVADIDRQLYKKYGLSEDEIDFIETHVKEMT